DDENGYGMDWESSGSFNEAEVGGSGKVGGLLSLREGDKPFPLQGEVSFGRTRIGGEGTMTAPKGLASLDVRLKLAGSSLSDLNALFGVALPTTPPFSTEGRLLAELEGEEDTWRYEDFKGLVGESDLRGSVAYQLREPRPLLTGKVASDQLRLQDLGPLVGADTSDAAPAEEAKDERKQPPGKARSEERRVGKEWRARWAPNEEKEKR